MLRYDNRMAKGTLDRSLRNSNTLERRKRREKEAEKPCQKKS